MTDLKEIYEQELKIANTNASLYDGEYFENLVIEKFKGLPEKVERGVVLKLFLEAVSTDIENAPNKPCKNGCSACCYYNLEISRAEAEYISVNTGAIITKNKIRNRNFHGVPCPFLKNDSCSIYEFRPYTCRRHFTSAPTNTFCDIKLSTTESNYTMPLVRSKLAQKLYVNIVGTDTKTMDIRQFFTHFTVS